MREGIWQDQCFHSHAASGNLVGTRISVSERENTKDGLDETYILVNVVLHLALCVCCEGMMVVRYYAGRSSLDRYHRWVNVVMSPIRLAICVFSHFCTVCGLITWSRHMPHMSHDYPNRFWSLRPFPITSDHFHHFRWFYFQPTSSACAFPIQHCAAPPSWVHNSEDIGMSGYQKSGMSAYHLARHQSVIRDIAIVSKHQQVLWARYGNFEGWTFCASLPVLCTSR